MIPQWFTVLSIIMLVLGGLCAIVIAADLLLGHRQHMWIMNIVWPVCALFGTLAVVWLYFKYGRLAAEQKVNEAKAQGEEPPSKTQSPFSVMVAKAALHCGSGCTLGDICAEFLALGVPAVAVAFGWRWLFPSTEQGKVFAVWILDYLFAFVIGVAFQYFTIVPMRSLPVFKGLVQAVKADCLSLTAWQVGMYGLMAIAQFAVFEPVWEQLVKPDRPEFWFTMQIAMLCGFITAYPVNWWLVSSGIKEKM